MSYVTQARPYAQAAYDVARKNNSVEEWWQSLLSLQQALSFPKVRSYLSNPTIGLDEKLLTLENICKEWMTEDVKRFARLLGEKGRLIAIDDICAIFLHIKEEASKKVRALFTTAFDLGESQQKALVGLISQKTGLDLLPEFSVDREIIGGAIVRFDGNVIDISVRKQLAQLKQNLIR